MTPTPNARLTPWGRLWRYGLLVAVALVFIFPVVFMVVSSLKPDDQLLRDTASLRAFLPVGDISLDNYFAAFRRAPVAPGHADPDRRTPHGRRGPATGP